jgi:RNA polymerase sigma factor (sigma-70 family)
MTNTRPNLSQLIHRIAESQRCEKLSDRDLLRSFVERSDETAFTTLVRRHGSMVLGLCRRILGNLHSAEDAFQATFLVLSRKAASLGTHESLANWLYSVAYRIAHKARVTEVRRRKHEERVSHMPVPDPLLQLTIQEGYEILDTELARMPDKFRAPLVLCYLQDLSRDEAARQLGWSLSTLKSRLEQAREQLRTRLAARGLPLAVTLLAALVSEGSAKASSRLVSTTVQGAVNLGTNAAMNSVISAEVAALTKGALKSMYPIKMKLAATMLAGIAVCGVALATIRTSAAGQDKPMPGVNYPVPSDTQPQARENILAAQVAQAGGGGQPAPQGAILTTSEHIESVKFSKDGQTLFSASHAKEVQIWDMATNKLKQTLKTEAIVRRVALSLDDKTVAAGIDGGVIMLWNVSGKLEAELKVDLPSQRSANGVSSTVCNLTFLPGDKLAALYQYCPVGKELNVTDGELRIWDLKTRTSVKLKVEDLDYSYDVVSSPDGKLLAVATRKGLKVWDLDRNEVVWRETPGENDFMSRVAFSPNGEKLAVGGGHYIVGGGGIGARGKVWMFDVKTKKELWCVDAESQRDAYNAIAFTADGSGLLTGSATERLKQFRLPNGGTGSKVVSEMRRWDVANGKEVWRIDGSCGSFASITVSADGKHIAATDNEERLIMIFDPIDGKLLKSVE